MGQLHDIVRASNHASESAGVDQTEDILANGGVWNELDEDDQTPGCIAYEKGLQRLYDTFVRAGIRSEVLLGRLERRIPHERDDGAAFLASQLKSTDDMLVDEQGNAVMMAWETDIMKRSAQALLPHAGMRVLNIGFGMGIFDSFVREASPAEHTIVEAHPHVLARLQKDHWEELPGVRILAGRWQDLVDAIQEKEYDAIYYDPYGDYYDDLYAFTDIVVNTLAPEGRFSFFNGLGADRQISYDVYQRVVEIDLAECAAKVEWHTISMDSPIDWKSTRRPYWKVKEYRLPVCRHSS